MKVEQSAGICKITVYTDGHPLWPEITIQALNGNHYQVRLSVDALHDLKYCIERVLAQLPGGR